MSIIKKQTIVGTIYAYWGVVIGAITQAFIIPNYLTTEENGLLALLSSWMFVFVLVSNFGFNSAGTRYFDKFRNAEKKHRGFLFNGLVFLAVGFFISSLLLFFFKEDILNSSTGDNLLFEKYYLYILPITFFTVLFLIFDNYAKGLYDTVTGNFLSQFLQRFLVLIAILFYVSKVVNFDLFVPIWAFAICFPTIFMIWRAYKLGNFSLAPKPFLFKSDFRKQFLNFAGFSMITGLSSIVITKLDILMVYSYLGLGKTGIYNTCLFFGSLMTISYLISVKASTAIVVDALEAKDYSKVKQIFVKSSVTQVILGMFLLTLVWINIDTLFSFIKPEYALGKYVLLIIGVAKLFDLASGINVLILAYSKYYKQDSILVITFVGVLFLLNHLLIPQYGLNGAAISVLLATIYFNCVRNFFIWKHFKIHPYTIKLLLVLFVGLVLIILGMLLPDVSSSLTGRLISLSYKSTLIGGAYIFAIYRFNISEDINKTINTGFKKIKSMF